MSTSDLITMWARRAPDPCPTCGAAIGDECATADGSVHAERVESHPVAAALGEFHSVAGPSSAADFQILVSTAVVAVAELVAHDQATREVFFQQLATACERAGRK